ncbi:hypothetical protein [Flavobacterium gelatinilyticum]|uniref:hypothetical protein n=1 Tax=Flavobacterium gelatinilyticum TaxID=3003260 RepID=UPI00248095DA|nr:hypothetical protein [Flavobacterium gelatinilyticum]
MDKPAQIKRALIEALGFNPNLPMTAEVVSVENTTCTVKLDSGLQISDVRLCATISESEDLFVMIPQIGSEVILLSQTGELSGLMVIKVDNYDSISYKKGDFEFLIDGVTGKVTLKNGSVNFGSLVSSLITEISSAVIVTPAGRGSIAPKTKLKLQDLDTKFKSILNTN